MGSFRRLTAGNGNQRCYIAALIGMTALAFALRLALQRIFTGHVDEPASLLAVMRVAETGWPELPSGVLYLPGTVFSYLGAPLAWLRHGRQLLDALQLLNVAISTFVVPLGMALVWRLTRHWLPAALAGVALATEPNLIVWNVAIRPYGLLALLTLAIVYIWVCLILDGSAGRLLGVRLVVWLVAIAWLGTFTHIGIWLIAPVLIVFGLGYWGRQLLGAERPLLNAAMLAVCAPIAYLIASSLVHGGSGTGQGAFSGMIGRHLFSHSVLTDPKIDLDMWNQNFMGSWLSPIIPLLIVASGGVLLGRWLWARSGEPAERAKSAAASLIVLATWIPNLLVALLVTSDPAPRYVLHLLPLGYITVVLAAWSLIEVTGSSQIGLSLRWGSAALVALIVIVNGADAASWRINWAGGSPDYLAASAWAAANVPNGQTIMTVLPPAAYSTFSRSRIAHDLLFLAGPATSSRSTRYVRVDKDGQQVDYWLGIPAITSTEGLCHQVLQDGNTLWLIDDRGRLTAPWALKGPMADIIKASTKVEFVAANGAEVRHFVTIPPTCTTIANGKS